ncbi:hypothetical protein [Devosia sp. LjRoot3]|uniref:hypothetical protein n=1 Tax=Devosia sp. LjRoot3 TaxID=3342319 RepID=UPI003ECCAD48
MSTSGPDTVSQTPTRRRLPLGWITGLAIVAVLLLANAHLVYVAFTSQPACVAHLKAPDGTPDHFRAAKSGC